MFTCNFFTYSKRGFTLDPYTLVRAFLNGRHGTFYNEDFYLYNSNLGIWEKESLEDLTTQVAVFCNSIVPDSWSIDYRSSVKEVVRVILTENQYDFASTDYILCLTNGVFDILTGELSPHSPEYFFTSNLGYKYNAKMKCPHFLKFLDDICLQNENRKLALLEFMGYALTYETRAEQMLYLHGSGANGKSTFLEILKLLVGKENYLSLEAKDLNDKYAKADILGKKVLAFPDLSIEDAKAGVTAKMKEIISGDEISSDRKYLSRLSFKPQAKLIFCSNHQISLLHDSTDGAQRRIDIFPFLAHFDETQRDVFLIDKLRKELPAILRYAREGYIRFKKNNFCFSNHEESKKILKKILSEGNPEHYFVTEMLEKKHSAFLSNKELQKAFSDWCTENNLEICNFDRSNLTFNLKKEFNAEKCKSTNGIRGWKNLAIKK